LFFLAGCRFPESDYETQKSIKRDQTARKARSELNDANSLQDYLDLTSYTWKSYLLEYNGRFIQKEELDSARRNWYITHTKLDKQLEDTILRGVIKLEMTQEQVSASWGRPHDVNRTVYSFGVHEQWVYVEYGSYYLYFEDGILTSWQD